MLRKTTITLVGSLLMAAPPDAAAAGFLDFLFAPQPAQAPPSATSDPLEMTVRPRKPKPQQRLSEPRTVLATPIDPVANPWWHLDDPTLRYGDIVVLPQGAMIYRGKAAERRLSDFERLSRTTLLSRNERERIRRMTDYKRDTDDGRARLVDKKVPSNQTASAASETAEKPQPSAQIPGN
ncbi:MAG: hypothetical protein DI537_33815 [Stutzerimonas stutzeri]|nr:MAG: hypothetical protein DI537_33815 [Stutzerimonas stutzeri]